MKTQNQIPVLFVAFSHTLSHSQIDGFKMQYGQLLEGCSLEDAQGYSFKIVNLAEVATDLQAAMSAIPATATLVEIQDLAQKIVAEAEKAGATHFFLAGEPTLTLWANLYAGNHNFSYKEGGERLFVGFGDMVCIQSTTERKSVEVTNPDGTVTKTQIHVQWREMF